MVVPLPVMMVVQRPVHVFVRDVRPLAMQRIVIIHAITPVAQHVQEHVIGLARDLAHQVVVNLWFLNACSNKKVFRNPKYL